VLGFFGLVPGSGGAARLEIYSLEIDIWSEPDGQRPMTIQFRFVSETGKQTPPQKKIIIAFVFITDQPKIFYEYPSPFAAPELSKFLYNLILESS
jgi:hypothetical protein